MEKKTFQDTMIANYLNEQVYAVKINMECRDTVTFKGKKFLPTEYAGGGVHSLVNELCVKRVGFPGNVFYDETLRFINSSSGYLEPFQLQTVTAYFAEGYYMQCSYEWFIEHYRPKNFFGKRAAPVPPEPK